MRINRIFSLVALLVTGITGLDSLHADVTLAKMFSDDMVLQRDQKVAVWGRAEPGEIVTVKFDGQSAVTNTNSEGKWQVELEPLKLGEPRTLTVLGKNTITLKNVLVGEVWLCSGQSNMEWGIGQLGNGKEEIANASHPDIRLLFVPKVVSPTPNEELPSSCLWRVCSPENIVKGTHRGGFSGTAYYFGRELHKKLGVPVGIIQSAWGGTRIEPWTAVAGFKSVPPLKDIYNHVVKSNRDYENSVKNSLDSIEKWQGQARKAIAENRPVPGPPVWPRSAIRDRQHPTALYNAMIHPMVPFAIKGAIWYQGEANCNDGSIYYQKMKALIQGWRRLWNNDQMPFYFVQLAPFTYRGDSKSLPVIWEAQSKAMKNIPHTGMAIINDIGNLRDIHPKNKQDVGKRLALWALAKTYKQDIDVYCGPVYKSYKIENGKVRISFDHSGTGLASRDAKALDWFEIAGADNKFVKAAAVIEGNEVVVSAASVTKPVSVRFAWDCRAEPNLMNKEGLPASAFRLGPENLAKGKPYTCTDPNNRGYGKGGLTDGSKALNNNVNCFASSDTAIFPKQVTVDLQHVCSIYNIGFGVPPYGSTKDVKVSISEDGKNFVEIGQHSFKLKKEQWQTFAVDSKKARYVRLTFTENHKKKVKFPQNFTFITELEVYGE